MKKLLTFLMFCFGVAVWGQQKDIPDYMAKAVRNYYSDIGMSSYPELKSDSLQSILNDSVVVNNQKLYVPVPARFTNAIGNFIVARDRQSQADNAIGEKKKMLLTDAALNTFFASEISSNVTSSIDLTFQKAYAVLSTSDKTLFLGGTFDTRDKETDIVRFLLTVGIKAKVDDDFATIYKNGKLQNDLGVNLKFHYIGKGSIFYTDDQAKKVNTFRDNLIGKLLKETVYDDAADQKSNDEKADDFYKKIAQAEVDYIRKFKLYNMSTDHWLTFETYIPVSPRQYNVIADITTTDSKKEDFYPWYVTAGATKYWKWSNDMSVYLSGFGNLKNNNNIETEGLTKYTQPVLSPENSSLIESNKTVYGGSFEQFITPTLNAEFASFLILKGTLGISSGIEKTFGQYDTLNWKLGIPVTLKDKDGKPSVNFEMVWKEVNKEHFVGVNVGFTFGKTIQ